MSVTLDAPPTRPVPGRGPWGAALVTLAAVIAFAFFGSEFEQSDDQIMSTTTLPPVALEERIPGLTGTMHVLTATPEGSRYVQWPVGRLAPVTTELAVPVGRFNADATRIGAVTPLPDDIRGDLWVGPPDDLSLAVPDVTGFAWHDSDPRWIASTRQLGGFHQLWLGEARDGGYVFRSVVTLPDGGVVEAFGDWGIAVRTDDGRDDGVELLIFDRSGTLLRQYAGTTVGHGGGHGGGVIISPDTGTAPIVGFRSGESEFDLPAGGNVLQVAWLAEGDRIAVSVEDDGVRYVRIVQDGLIVSETRIAAQRLHWSPDGRFLIITTTNGQISILDTAASSLVRVPVPGPAFEAVLTAA